MTNVLILLVIMLIAQGYMLYCLHYIVQAICVLLTRPQIMSLDDDMLEKIKESADDVEEDK